METRLELLKKKIKDSQKFTNDMFEEEIKYYVSCFIKGADIDPTVFTQGFDVGDLHGIDIELSKENIRSLTFVKEAFSQKQIKEFGIEEIIEQGKASSKMEKLHKQGITGKGTSVGIIDSCFVSDRVGELSNDNRKVNHIIIYKDENGVVKYRNNYESKEDQDDFHGKTTACITAGNKCGIAPESNLFLFQMTGVNREEARILILDYIKNNNIELDVISDPSFNKNNNVFQECLYTLSENESNKGNSEYFSTEDFWKNCLWGRAEGKELVIDKIANAILEELAEINPQENQMKDRMNIMKDTSEKVLIPCTGMTSLQENFKDKNKYYGSVCGGSFPTVFLGGLFSLARQINPKISKNDFFDIMRDTADINTDGMKYLNIENMIKEIKKQNQTDLLSTKQKIAQILQKNSFLMKLPFVEKFVGNQLNVLPPAQKERTKQTGKSSRQNFLDSLSCRILSKVQQMSNSGKAKENEKKKAEPQDSKENDGR